MIKIRPHHLLCIHGFQGKGYNDEFVENMTTIVNKIKNNKEERLKVVYHTDDICHSCPHKLGENLCNTQEKVLKLDKGVVKSLKLQEAVYSYTQILEKIRDNFTIDDFKKICSKCTWYANDYCRDGIFNSLK